MDRRQVVVRVRLDVAEALADAVHVDRAGDVALRVVDVERDVHAAGLEPHPVEHDEFVARDLGASARERDVRHADVLKARERLHDVHGVFRAAAVGYERLDGRRVRVRDGVDRDLDKRVVEPF